MIAPLTSIESTWGNSKKEVEYIVQIGVSLWSNYSKWVPLSFSKTKSITNRSCSLTNSIILNKQLKWQIYSIPKIKIPQNIEGFQYATSLDQSMEYYHIILIKNTINLCTIITHWSKYKHKLVPMGVSKPLDVSNRKWTKKV